MLEDIIKERLKKLEHLKAAGVDPYPASVTRTHTIGEVVEKFSTFVKSRKAVSIVGRVVGLRDQGALLFADLQDESGKIQLVIKKDNVENFALLQQTLDIGDFFEAKGKAFVTKRGEKSIEVSQGMIAAKAIRPAPFTFYDVKDTETLLRKRYMDLMIHPELREQFRKKTVFWEAFRLFLIKEGFLEVETPVLELTPGGADAEPFQTHHNALNMDLYLRISLEISLKKLLVGGFENIFEIGRIFRNEGIDAEHLQDYTQMELYWAWHDYEDLMKLIEKLYKFVIKETMGTLKTKRGDATIDWSKKWAVVDYFAIFKKEIGLDLNTVTDSELRAYATKQGLDVGKHPGRGRVIDLIFKKIRHTLIQPCFLINPPVDVEPLAKRIAPGANRVARFQVVAAGTELGKGFSELNDPIDQRARFEEQSKLREQGDKEAQRLDEDFLEAMEYGMPPTAGFGLSERLFAILMDKPVRETVFFPLMKVKKD